MDKKDVLQKLLDNLSEDELSTLFSQLSTLHNKDNKDNKTKKKKRGRGKRKQNKKTKPNVSSDHNIIDSFQLTPEEKQELKEASKFDKEKGVDKPKKHGIILPSRKFQKVSIQCMDCRKTFKISPSLMPLDRDRYKCNSCICRGRSR